MPRVALTVTEVTHEGVAYPTPDASVAASDHELDANDGRIILIIENVSGSTRNVTVLTSATFGDPPIDLQDPAYAIAAGDKIVAGPFSPRLFNQAGDIDTVRAVLVDVDGSNGDVEFVALQVPISVT